MKSENITDWVAEFFLKQNIDRVFLYPGGTIAPLVNACIAAGIKIENFKNEQGAGYAALAYSRISGIPQVVMVTSGPGVTNLMTVIADAYYDSTPLIVITGQIGTKDLKSRKGVRQRGFQETPTVDITAPISKSAILLDSAKKVGKYVPEAFILSMSGRKGPVVLDFPMDIQRSQSKALPLINNIVQLAPGLPNKTYKLTEIIKQIKKSKKIMILLGNGAHSLDKLNVLNSVVKKLNALVVTSFLGVGTFNTKHKNFLGYIGHTGNYAANIAVSECDFLIVLGSRLDIRQTGTEVAEFVKNGKILWVDIDKTELANPRIKPTWSIHDDLGNFLNIFSESLRDYQLKPDREWIKKIISICNTRLDDVPTHNNKIQPRDFLDRLEEQIQNIRTIVATGVGCHQHWVARHLSFNPKKKLHISSGGHGAMGFDLPSAIGASILQPKKTTICIVGDGSFLMNIQELASLKERNLNLKIIVLNNARLGMVSQFQLITFGDDPTTGDVDKINFFKIANGFGIPSANLHKKKDIVQKVKWLLASPGPALLEVLIDPLADVVPMLLAGKKMNDMWMKDGK